MPEQWWMAIGGHQVGPVSEEELVTNLRNGTVDGGTLVFTAGMSNWAPVREVPQLSAYTAGAPRSTGVPPPPVRAAHEIDFKIQGTEMQFVEMELDPKGFVS